MSGDLHPDYLKAPEEARWKTKLDALFVQLSREARHINPSKADVAEDRGWCWRILRGGAVVGMRKRTDLDGDRYELRIARSGELTPEAESRFDTELGVFLKKFQIEATNGRTPAKVPGCYWLRLPKPEKEKTRPAARYLSLMLGEITPGKALCWDCLNAEEPVETVVPWSPAFGLHGQACHACALERGRREPADAAQAQLPLEEATP